MKRFESELQRLIALAKVHPLTAMAIRELPLHYQALRTYKTLDDYRLNLRKDQAAIVALCLAVQFSMYQVGALKLLLIGSGYRLQLAEAVAPDPSVLLSLLWQACYHCPKAPYRWVLGRCLEARRSHRADQKRAETWTNDRAEDEKWVRGFEDCGKSDPETDFKLREILEGAISKLSPRQKEAILLYLQGYEQGEIASKMGLTPERAKDFTQKARTNLKLFLKL